MQAKRIIRLGEEYLGILYDYLHKRLYEYHVIQADETLVIVNKDGRKAGSKSWMWGIYCRRKFHDALVQIPKEH